MAMDAPINGSYRPIDAKYWTPEQLRLTVLRQADLSSLEDCELLLSQQAGGVNAVSDLTSSRPQPLAHRDRSGRLRVRPRTLLQWAREGKIPAHSLSGAQRRVWRFLRSDLDGMLSSSSAGSAEGRQH